MVGKTRDWRRDKARFEASWYGYARSVHHFTIKHECCIVVCCNILVHIYGRFCQVTSRRGHGYVKSPDIIREQTLKTNPVCGVSQLYLVAKHKRNSIIPSTDPIHKVLRFVIVCIRWRTCYSLIEIAKTTWFSQLTKCTDYGQDDTVHL